MRGRRGFALITVLAAIVAASLISVTTMTVARDGVGQASYRADRERAFWQANGCLAILTSAVESILKSAIDEDDVLRSWRELSDKVAPTTQAACSGHLEPAGVRIDVNAAEYQQLLVLFQSLGEGDADLLASAVLDWLDADHQPRAAGTETAVRGAYGSVPPRNGAIADIRELHAIPAVARNPALLRYLDVDPGRISLNHAAPEVLGTVPGLTPEVIARIATERAAGRYIDDVLNLRTLVSNQSADSLIAQYPVVVRMSTTLPDAWQLIAISRVGAPPIKIRLQLTIVRDGRSAVPIRWRTR